MPNSPRSLRTHSARFGAVALGALAVTVASLSAPPVAGADARHAARAVTGAATAPVTGVTPTQPIGHVGRWLTDADGRVVLLHGVNFVSKGVGIDHTPAADGLGDDDAQWMHDNGFDVVRLGTTAASIMPTPGVIDTAYVDSFAATVDMLTAHGLLVLVDLHQDGWGPELDGDSLGDDGFPGWMTLTHGATNTHTGFPTYYITNPAIEAAFQSFWDNETGPGGVTVQAQVAKMLGALAAKVGTNPGVLGYDLLNEPWPGKTWAPCATDPAGCPAQDAAIDAFYTRAAAAIRAHDTTHLLFPEPYVLFNFGGAPTNISLAGGDTNSGMSWHLYTLDPSLEPAVVKFADDWSTRTGGALLNTEFGATSDPVAINRMTGLLDDSLQPWIWWAYNEFVHDMSQPPTDDNITVPAVDAIVRPHPVAVAGTPTADHYDPATKELTFSFSTAKAGGGSFPCGTVTSLQTPARSYPDGYHVKVTGGIVTSAAGSAQLSVVANRGASTVSVEVLPGGSTTPSAVATACPATVTTTTPAGGTTTTAPSQPAVAVESQPTYTG